MTATIQEIFGDDAIYDRENNTVTIDLKNFELTQENAEKLLAAIIIRNEQRTDKETSKVIIKRPLYLEFTNEKNRVSNYGKIPDRIILQKQLTNYF